MPWPVAANGIGILIAAIWFGWTASIGHIAWAALGSVPTYFLGMLYPFMVEYRALGRGFQRLDEDVRDRSRRARGEAPQVEIFGGSGSVQPPPMFRRRSNPTLFAIVLFVIATGLLVGDIGWFIATGAGQALHHNTGVIANF